MSQRLSDAASPGRIYAKLDLALEEGEAEDYHTIPEILESSPVAPDTPSSYRQSKVYQGPYHLTISASPLLTSST